MRNKILLTALFCAIFISGFSQYAHQNISLLSQWDSTAIPQEPSYWIRYNSVWGWVNPLDNKEYAILGSTEGTHFIEVTNPALPKQRDFVPGPINQCIWREYKTYKTYCYMVSDDNSGSNKMQIIDMRYLPDSVHVVYNSSALVTRSHTLFIDGDKLYLGIPKGNSVGGASHLAVYSLLNPIAPVFLRQLETDNLNGVGDSHDMFVRNDTIYSSMGYSGLFLIKYDSVANTFTEVGSLTSYPNQGYNHSSALTKNGHTLIFSDEVPAGLPIKALNVTNFGNLTIQSQFRSTVTSTATPHNPFIRENDNTRMVMAYYQDGVQIFNITNPTNVVRTGYFDTNPTDCPGYPNPNYTGCWGVYIDLPSGIILASDMQSGLFVLNADTALAVNVKNSEFISGISVYPNPSNSNFNLELKMKAADKIKYDVLDVSGRIISHVETDLPSGNNNLIINTENLSQGIYLLKVTGTDFTRTEKLIKQN